MGLSTLLEIVTRACDELALPRPSAVAGAADNQTRQLLGLLNRGGKAMMREHAWRDLVTLGTITTVNGTEDYAYPADFDRLVAETEWDRTNDWRLVGPLWPQEDRWQRESLPVAEHPAPALPPRRRLHPGLPDAVLRRHAGL